MSDRLVAIIALVFALFVGGLSFIAFHYYGKAAEQEKEIAQTKQDLTEAQFLLTSQAAAATSNNLTAGKALDEQSTNTQESVKTQTVIKTVLVSAPCSVVAVPAAAADSLLDKFRKVSASAAGANSSKSITTVPAVSAAK